MFFFFYLTFSTWPFINSYLLHDGLTEKHEILVSVINIWPSENMLCRIRWHIFNLHTEPVLYVVLDIVNIAILNIQSMTSKNLQSNTIHCWYLLTFHIYYYTRHWSKCFILTNSYNLHDNIMRHHLFLDLSEETKAKNSSMTCSRPFEPGTWNTGAGSLPRRGYRAVHIYIQ